uniref:Uncharacterized protein n=1 Tax=Ciona intestinalis TaxID=7719 RepID=H2XSS9_CIOIN
MGHNTCMFHFIYHLVVPFRFRLYIVLRALFVYEYILFLIHNKSTYYCL